MSTVTSTSNSASTSIQQAAQSIISGSTQSSTDVNTLVTALVNAKVAGKTAALTGRATRDNNQLTAIGTLKSVLSLLQSALTPLTNGSAFNTFTASASGKGLTASAGKGVAAGSYAVDVKNIAASQSITSGAFTSKAALGAGSLTLSVGGKSTTVNIESGKSTLADIAAAINSASGNPGVSATVVNGVDGAHLMLHSTSTGLANGINIQVKSDSADLNKLSVKSSVSTTTPATTQVDDSGNWKQSVAGEDAHLSISGMEIESASNTVTSAIDGLTLNLSADAVDNPQTLTIAQDVTDQKTAISAFVTAYNNFVTSVASFAGFDSTKKAGSQGGVLLGDSTVNAIRNTLAGAISGGLKQGSGMANLAAIGITLQKDGTLKTDDVKLTNALTTDPTGVAALFNLKTGMAASMNTSLTSFLKTGGMLDAHSNALTADLKSISSQQAQLTDYTDKLTKGYNAQFTALNTLMTQMSQNGDYLTALFGGKNSAGALANNK
jgi:flagellar hook-associated protein 2